MEKYCDNNVTSLQYYCNSYGEYLTEAFTGAGGVVKFLKNMFAEMEAPKVCKIQNVTTTRPSLNDVGVFGDELERDLKALFRLLLGPSLLS